ncbi:MAG: BadF/BadG/BcrA/BcrD ATPase family protein [Candidatus Dormibacteria bacterium]
MTAATGLYLGIDGGGSRVRTLALDLDLGSRSAREHDVPADFSSIPGAEVLDALEQAARSAWEGQARVADCAFAGIAGCVTADQRDAVVTRLLSIGIARSVVVHHDAYTTWFGATGGRPGVIVIAGTGSSVFTVDPGGGELLVGGFGAVFGDEGSGSDLGREALRAAAAAEDGYGPGERLRRAVLEALGIGSMREAMDLQHASEAGWLARLAPRLLDLAGGGDPAAQAILRSRLGCLADQIAVAVDACDPSSPTPVFGAGSLFMNDRYLDGLATAVRERRPRATLQRSARAPVEGAVLAAVARAPGADGTGLERALELLASR